MNDRYRTLVFSLIELTSPLHIGGGTYTAYTYQPVIRDSRDIPFIPGGTLSGSFASSLDEKAKKAWLALPQDNDTPPSPLIFNDAYPIPKQSVALYYPVEVRDQVTLSRDSLTAKEDHHFNMEVLPIGAVFCFFCRIDLEDNESTKEFLEKISQFLASGDALGGKVRAGSGCWVAKSWTNKTFDMTSPDDLVLWLNKGHGFHWNGNWKILKDNFNVEPEPLTPISQGSWQMELKIVIEKGPHLMAGSSGLPKKDSPDLNQAQRAKIDRNGELDSEPVDYGTAVKGRLRTAMEMLLRTYLRAFCKVDATKTKELVPIDPTEKPGWEDLADFFGYTGKKGLWSVKESPWRGAIEYNAEDHIRLDEFTQHVMKHAKFDFFPLTGGETRVSVCLSREAGDWQKELISHAGDLLALNILPWGGHGSRGYIGARIEKASCDSFCPGGLKALFKQDTTAWKGE